MSVFGIDLGTCYSCVAVCDETGHIEVKTPMNQTEPTVPSVVSFENDGTPIVGRAARTRLMARDESSIDAVKREMNEEFCKKELKINGAKRKVSPAEISACVLRYLFYNANKVVVNQDRKPEVRQAVITIPAMFNDTQREKTKLAAEKAGIEVLGLLQEPTAAAISYNIKHGETILVFDLGGGTLDVSIVKNDLGALTVLGVPAGDINLGGKDWDESMVNFALKTVGQDPQTINHEKKDWARLMNVAEECKKVLTQSSETDFEINLPSAGLYSEFVTITRSQFEKVTRPLVERAMTLVERAIENADTPVIDRFVLVGGSSCMPMILRALEQKFSARYAKGRRTEDWLVLSDPAQAIAKGAAKYAGILSGVLNGSYSIVDKATHSYGFRCGKDDNSDDLVIANMIYSTDPMVISNRHYALQTRYDNCEAVTLAIIENDSGEEVMDYNDEPVLVSVELPLPPNTPARSMIKIILNRDNNGIINVVAECNGSKIEFESQKTNQVSSSIQQQIEKTIKKMKSAEK